MKLKSFTYLINALDKVTDNLKSIVNLPKYDLKFCRVKLKLV